MKKIVKGILVVLIILCVIYICSVVYKYTILNNIKIGLTELNKSDNFYYDNGQSVWYHKDGISKWTYDENSDGLIIWTDGTTTYLIKDGVKEEIDGEKYKNLTLNLRMHFDYNLEEINVLKLALNPFNKVKSEKINDEKIIKVEYTNGDIWYFNYETKVPIKCEFDDGSKFEYEFKQNCVTNDDLNI